MRNLATFKSLAVLIDGENISPKTAISLLVKLNSAKFGLIRRVYADFASPQSAAWSEVLKKYALTPHHVPRLNSGKNACDIQLAIDAMDLLHSGNHDGFCIVSSDSDFSAVAIRIRQQGIPILGFGEEKTPTSFREACSSFQRLNQPNILENIPIKTPAKQSNDDKNLQLSIKILQAIGKLGLADSWISQGEVGNKLAQSGIKPKEHGFKNLTALISATQIFESKLNENGLRSLRLRNVKSNTSA